jgi:hypothetical protein
MSYETWIILLVFVIYFSIFLFFTNIQTNRKKKRQAETKTKLFKVLFAGLNSGAIVTLDDVVNVYKGVAGLTTEDLSFRYGLSTFLREFLVSVISNDQLVVGESVNTDRIVKLKEIITNFLQRNEATSPFADLPSAERNILNDIFVFLDKKDIESIKRKSVELAAMIQARHSDLEKIQGINRWTTVLTIVGLILSVVFGILALVK